jgi:Ala-tRNA(Pro) deacylase
MTCRERLEALLKERGIQFKVQTHEPAYTAQELAGKLHVPGRRVAKVVIALAGPRPVMLVLPAPDQVDLEEVGRMLGVPGAARLASEDEIRKLFPDCEVGAEPPFGGLYGLHLLVDRQLIGEPEIVFRIGTHDHVMRLRYDDYAKVAKPVTGQFARRPESA